VKRFVDQSYYEILEIPRDAPSQEVEKAYARAMALYGPGSLATYTLMAPEEAALLTRRIEEARAVLLDPESRAGYDARLGADGEEGRPPEQRVLPIADLGPGFPPVIPPVAHTAAGSTPAAPTAPTPTPTPTSIPAPTVARLTPAAFSVPVGATWTGELLRRAREARGLTLQQIAERTKVTRHHLENIEADRYAQLPPPVYLRGILMSLAKELRLDGQRVARSYLEAVAAAMAQHPSKPR
jgi:curved DNA-binding protein CbpA